MTGSRSSPDIVGARLAATQSGRGHCTVMASTVRVARQTVKHGVRVEDVLRGLSRNSQPSTYRGAGGDDDGLPSAQRCRFRLSWPSMTEVLAVQRHRMPDRQPLPAGRHHLDCPIPSPKMTPRSSPKDAGTGAGAGGITSTDRLEVQRSSVSPRRSPSLPTKAVPKRIKSRSVSASPARPPSTTLPVIAPGLRVSTAGFSPAWNDEVDRCLDWQQPTSQ